MHRDGQMVVVAAMLITVVLMAVAVSVYETQLVYLRTRSIVVREVVGAITSDFERALAHVLALASRAYFNYSRFYAMCSRYSIYGMEYTNRHNFTIARRIGINYLESWRTFIVEAYAGYGVQVDFELERLNLSEKLGRPRYLGDDEETGLIKGFWYYPTSVSVAHARLMLNLTNVGFYGWESPVTVALYLRIHPEYNSSKAGNWSLIKIQAFYDSGDPYPYLLTRGWIEIYYPSRQYWVKANITDITYEGIGTYSINFTPYVEPVYDPIDGGYILPLMVVVGDDRGIVVEAATYNRITFRIKRRIPQRLSYYVGRQVYCQGSNKLWVLEGRNGSSYINGYLRFYLWGNPSTRRIRLRYEDGSEQWITLPRDTYIYMYFDHDSGRYGDGFINSTSSVLHIENIHAQRIMWGLTRIDNVTIIHGYLTNFAGTLSRIDLEFAGGWVNITSPCSNVGHYGASWYLSLDDVKWGGVVEVAGGGEGVVVNGRASSGVLEREERAYVNRPERTLHEVYTLEFGWDLNIYWLGMRLPSEGGLRLPPVPFMPVKQLRVNISYDGTVSSLRKRPIQYENWRNVSWHGIEIPMPVGLADPQMDFNETDRLIFQVTFPNVTVDYQYVAIWWSDDLDAEPEAYPTQIEYVKPGTEACSSFLEERGYDPGNYDCNDVYHPLYDVEFVDMVHSESRGYVDYGGVAAFVMRDPVTDHAFGPYNLHAFDTYGYKLGRYRPNGTWVVYDEYMRYSWIKAPIRIFAVLSTEIVGNVYNFHDYEDSYYATTSIVEIINGTRYIPVITYIYWKNTRSGDGYWLVTAMGRGLSEWFAYIDLYNSTGNTPFTIYEMPDVREEPYPSFMITYWNDTGGLGRAIILNERGVELLYDIAGDPSYPKFASTKSAPGGRLQGSIEYLFWSYSVRKSIGSGTVLSYWTVLLDYEPTGTGDEGWLSVAEDEGWKNAYVYAPMFLEEYAPMVARP